jgi:hypothetical protein
MSPNKEKLECFQFPRNLKYLLSTVASSSFRRHAINLTETKMDSLPHVWRSVIKSLHFTCFQFPTFIFNNNGSNLTLHLSPPQVKLQSSCVRYFQFLLLKISVVCIRQCDITISVSRCCLNFWQQRFLKRWKQTIISLLRISLTQTESVLVAY